MIILLNKTGKAGLVGSALLLATAASRFTPVSPLLGDVSARADGPYTVGNLFTVGNRPVVVDQLRANVDDGSRRPQVYTLYGTAAEDPDLNDLATWSKISGVDTRPNKTGTLFCEIDAPTTATLATSGEAVVTKPAPIEHVWVVFKTHLDIGYTDRINEVLKKYRVNMMDNALKVIESSRELPAENHFSWTLAGWPLTYVLGPEQDPARRGRIEQAVRDATERTLRCQWSTPIQTEALRLFVPAADLPKSNRPDIPDGVVRVCELLLVLPDGREVAPEQALGP
jgi:hypothetical protein